MNLKMGLDHMFKYREILEKKAEATRKALGECQTLSLAINSITVIDMLLQTALFNTVSESAPQLVKAISFFDREALQLAMPEHNFKVLMPTQVSIDFESAEVIVPAPHSINIPVGTGTKGVMEEIAKILSKNFVIKIPEAINKYKELTGQKLTNVKVWEEIKKGLPESRLIPTWDRHLATTFRMQGPIIAFTQVKKHLPDWSDMDIATLLCGIVNNEIKIGSFSDARDLQSLIDSLGSVNIHNVAKTPLIAEAIRLYDRKDASDQDILKRVATINAFCNPSKREQIVKRREYVEKGY